MKIWRIDNIEFPPLMVLAHSVRQAERTFVFSLITGLQNRPAVQFDVDEWGPITDHTARKTIETFAASPLPGIVWNVDDGRGWELVPKRFTVE